MSLNFQLSRLFSSSAVFKVCRRPANLYSQEDRHSNEEILPSVFPQYTTPRIALSFFCSMDFLFPSFMCVVTPGNKWPRRSQPLVKIKQKKQGKNYIIPTCKNSQFQTEAESERTTKRKTRYFLFDCVCYGLLRVRNRVRSLKRSDGHHVITRVISHKHEIGMKQDDREIRNEEFLKEKTARISAWPSRVGTLSRDISFTERLIYYGGN